MLIDLLVRYRFVILVTIVGATVILVTIDPGTLVWWTAVAVAAAGIAGYLYICAWFLGFVVKRLLDDTIRKAISKRDSS